MKGLRRILILGLIALAPLGLGGCTLYLSDHPLSSAYPPNPCCYQQDYQPPERYPYR